VSTVLGLDTATPDTVVAVTRDGEPLAESIREPDPGSGRPVHATAVLVEADRAVAAAGGWEGIDRIAVGVGPGSFTGLRIGIAAARALAVGLEVPLVGIGTLAVLAAEIAGATDGRPALAVIDARRGEAFAALHAPDGSELWAPFVASGDELAGRVAGLEPAPVAVGDGSIRFRRQLEDAGALVAEAESPAHRVSARRLCLLGEAADATPPERVLPIYLRRPDAQTWLTRQRGGTGDR
jgi:tRNA threonylcarbamoyladenosine biosynthesis protein TsaB